MTEVAFRKFCFCWVARGWRTRVHWTWVASLICAIDTISPSFPTTAHTYTHHARYFPLSFSVPMPIMSTRALLSFFFIKYLLDISWWKIIK